ncbi:hypothetical protein MIR68_000587 [Amoeboaphelidium protococcarum]|nr:hypothetical protein MIR68_000587 [Amoeboaphelidium protococcarum]
MQRFIMRRAINVRYYHQKVLDHYANPRNVGSMPKSAKDVGTGLVGAPACGDVMKLQVKINADTLRIEDVKFKTFGCGSAIASSSFATEKIKGLMVDDVVDIRLNDDGKPEVSAKRDVIGNTVIAKELSLPPVKLHCSMLAEDAVRSAIADYLKKNPDMLTKKNKSMNQKSDNVQEFSVNVPKQAVGGSV